jgi:hypothetical protein
MLWQVVHTVTTALQKFNERLAGPHIYRTSAYFNCEWCAPVSQSNFPDSHHTITCHSYWCENSVCCQLQVNVPAGDFFPPLPYASGMRCITPPTELMLCGLSTGIMSPLNVFVYLDDRLTVHPSITSVIFQLDAQNSLYIIHLLKSSTCFEQYAAHLQEVLLYLCSILYHHSLQLTVLCTG